MQRARLPYILSTLTFMTVAAWLSVKAYDSMISQIYYGPIKGYLAGAFSRGGADHERAFRTRAAIFDSRATARSFQDPGKYDALVAAWRRVLAGQRVSNDVIDGRALVGGALDSYNVLVLPLATRLSDAEMVSIRDFVSRKGRGLIFAGTAGAEDESGRTREISLAAEILGADVQSFAPSTAAAAAYMILDGRSALGANIPSGLRLGVSVYDRPVSARLLETRAEASGYWEEEGVPRREFSSARTGLAAGGYRGGRFVWTGFLLGGTIDPNGVKAGEILARNMLAYASFSPVFAKEPWPLGKQAAVVFSLDAGEELEGAGAKLFSSRLLPCTFFCATEAAQRSPAAFKALAAEPLFEIAVRGTDSSPDQPFEKQRAALELAKKTLTSLGARSVRGFSPLAAPDKDTSRALLDAGYAYLAGGGVSWGPPSLLEARRPLISVGRRLKLLLQIPPAGGVRPATLEELTRDFDAVYRVGGLYNLSIPRGALKDKKQAETYARFLDYVKTKNVWLARFEEAADWTSRWMLIDVESTKVSEVRSNLIVTSSSAGELENLRFNVHLPGDGAITARSEKMGGVINVVSQGKREAVLEIRGLRGEGLVFFVDRD